jgi:hypothetical protein
MLFREIIDVCYRNDSNPMNALCGQNSELLNIKAGGTYNASYH